MLNLVNVSSVETSCIKNYILQFEQNLSSVQENETTIEMCATDFYLLLYFCLRKFNFKLGFYVFCFLVAPFSNILL